MNSEQTFFVLATHSSYFSKTASSNIPWETKHGIITTINIFKLRKDSVLIGKKLIARLLCLVKYGKFVFSSVDLL